MKKVYLIIIFLCYFFSISVGQERKFLISCYTTFDYSNIPNSDLIDHRGKLAFGVGFQTNYAFNDKVELLVGAAYLDKGFREEITHKGPYDGIETNIYTWHKPYFSIPVKFQYNFSSSVWKIYSAAGIENDISIGGNGDNVKWFAQSLTFNLGISKLIKDKWRLGFEPTFRRNIQTYGVKGGIYETRPDFNPYSFGLKIVYYQK